MPTRKNPPWKPPNKRVKFDLTYVKPGLGRIGQAVNARIGGKVRSMVVDSEETGYVLWQTTDNEHSGKMTSADWDALRGIQVEKENP